MEEEKLIPKRVAAVDVHFWATRAKYSGIALIISVFFVAVFSNLHKYAGAASAGIISIGAAYYVKIAMSQASYLEEMYNIKPKKRLRDLIEDDNEEKKDEGKEIIREAITE